jgi:hypothetical protein
MLKSIYLNHPECTAMEMLAEGKRLKDVREAVSESIPRHYFYAFLASLRLKTGIADIQDVSQCTAYRSAMEQIPTPPIITDRHVRLLQWLIARAKPMIIAGKMGITEDEAKEQTEDALRACGIFSKDPRTRRTQARQYFAVYGNPAVRRPPPSKAHLRILRAIANGEDPAKLPGLEHANIPLLAKEACQRINAVSPGRFAQKKLIQAYFAAQDAAMDDPMF